MKNNTFLRWWYGLNLQVRLFLAFSLLFVYCVLVLSIFLFNVVHVIDLNNQAQAIYQENRQIYHLIALTNQYQLRLAQFKINASDTSREALSSLGEYLDETVSSAKTNQPEDISTNLDNIKNQLKKVAPVVEQLITAVDNGNPDQTQSLDKQVQEIIGPLHDELRAINQRSDDELKSVTEESETYSNIARGIAILSIPIFLFLVIVVILLVYGQINRPLETLSAAAQSLLEGKFQPADLGDLPQRGDEIGKLAQEFINMADSVGHRSGQLQQEAAEIRSKIR